MASLAETTKAALVPWVGVIVADACLRAAASSLGVAVLELGCEHLDTLETSIRRLLEPVAPANAIEGVILDIRRSMNGA